MKAFDFNHKDLGDQLRRSQWGERRQEERAEIDEGCRESEARRGEEDSLRVARTGRGTGALDRMRGAQARTRSAVSVVSYCSRLPSYFTPTRWVW